MRKSRERRGTKAALVPRPPIGAIWGWAQVALARNATETLIRGTALVLSPHPDDETIGCGLLLAQMAREGHLTAVGLASDGGDGWFSVMPRPTSRRIAEVRRGEWHRALDALNVPIGRRFELGLPDGTLRDHEDDVTEWVSNLLRQLSPSQIFVPRPLDPHPDHRALAKATLRSVIDVYGSVSDRGPGGGESFLGQRSSTLPEVYSYRVYPGEGLWPAGRPSEPTLLPTLLQLARSASGLIARPPLVLRAAKSKPDKKAAINAHESQRTLLDGELRYVWRTGVELYWKMSASSDSTATHP